MDKSFNKFIELLGVFTFGVIGVAIPMLATFSIVYEWTCVIQVALLVATCLEVPGIALLAAGVMDLEEK